MDDLEVATAAASAAAEAIRNAGERFGTRMKGAVDPVTEVDLAAERAALDVLRTHRPDDDVLSEESGGRPGDRTWVVDPLDGTVNFVQGIEHYGVSVALWRHRGPLVAVIVDVVRDRTYRAVSGEGAEVDGGALRVVSAKPVDVVVATGFPYDRREQAPRYGSLVEQLLTRFRGVRRFGAATLDFAWVAEGRLGGYVEIGLAPWDVAAGILLVREAGGLVVDERGDPAELGSRAFAAGPQAVVESLLASLDVLPT
jgi:myo-inositol-1(or 4)-monophosphatase